MTFSVTLSSDLKSIFRLSKRTFNTMTCNWRAEDLTFFGFLSCRRTSSTRSVVMMCAVKRFVSRTITLLNSWAFVRLKSGLLLLSDFSFLDRALWQSTAVLLWNSSDERNKLEEHDWQPLPPSLVKMAQSHWVEFLLRASWLTSC